jgi:hypothetical protein
VPATIFNASRFYKGEKKKGKSVRFTYVIFAPQPPTREVRAELNRNLRDAAGRGIRVDIKWIIVPIAS